MSRCGPKLAMRIHHYKLIPTPSPDRWNQHSSSGVGACSSWCPCSAKEMKPARRPSPTRRYTHLQCLKNVGVVQAKVPLQAQCRGSVGPSSEPRLACKPRRDSHKVCPHGRHAWASWRGWIKSTGCKVARNRMQTADWATAQMRSTKNRLLAPKARPFLVILVPLPSVHITMYVITVLDLVA